MLGRQRLAAGKATAFIGYPTLGRLGRRGLMHLETVYLYFINLRVGGSIRHRLCLLREGKHAVMATNFGDRHCCSGDSAMKH